MMNEVFLIDMGLKETTRGETTSGLKETTSGVDDKWCWWQVVLVTSGVDGEA